MPAEGHFFVTLLCSTICTLSILVWTKSSCGELHKFHNAGLVSVNFVMHDLTVHTYSIILATYTHAHAGDT